MDLWKNGISEIISNLYKLDFDCLPRVGKKKYDKHIDFQKGMQVIRLINLAHQSYRNDFDLAFSLVVAAIEAIAQIAVKTEDIPDILNEEEHFKDDVNPKHQDYNEWKKCKEYYGEFLDHYKQLKRFVEENHKNRELKKRFQGFILKYCPLSEWEIKEESKYSLLTGIDDLNTIKTIRNVLEDRPIDFPGDIFRDTYNYRSKYFHAGKHTDHNMPTCQIFSRFFQQIINPMKKEKFDDFIKERSGDSIPVKELEEFYLYLLTYDAISMIARKSISNYISEYLRINQD